MEEIIRLNLVLQSVLHKIEDISEGVFFKHELKKRANYLYQYSERIVEGATRNVNDEEAEQWQKLVQQLDETLNGFEIEVNEAK